MLREMTVEDLEDVKAVDMKALAGTTAGRGLLPPRRRELMEAYLAAGGGQVAVVDGTVAGFVFWHRWGAYGWLGPLALDPVLQDPGIGRRLVEAARARLISGGVRVVGLETWPEEGENLTLYARLSFQWNGFCLLLTRSAAGEKAPIPPVPVDDPALVRRVAASVLPGFDPYPAVAATLRSGLGELFAGTNGFVLCQRGGSREGTGSLGQIKLLLVEPGADPPLAGTRGRTGRLLEAACAYFRAVGMREMLLPLYADQQRWLPDLLADGWRIAGATLRAYYPAPPPVPRGTAFFSLVG